jgi:hypothetical protein
MIFKPGLPRIALLSGYAGTKVKTLWLPSPDPGQPTLEWIEKGFNAELIDGSESNRRLGWLPELRMKWSFYNEIDPGGNLTVGSADGNVADLVTLLALLDNPPGWLTCSPGPTAGGFLVNRVTLSPIGVVTPLGIPEGLELTLRGGLIYSSKVLGTF